MLLGRFSELILESEKITTCGFCRPEISGPTLRGKLKVVHVLSKPSKFAQLQGASQYIPHLGRYLWADQMQNIRLKLRHPRASSKPLRSQSLPRSLAPALDKVPGFPATTQSVKASNAQVRIDKARPKASQLILAMQSPREPLYNKNGSHWVENQLLLLVLPAIHCKFACS